MFSESWFWQRCYNLKLDRWYSVFMPALLIQNRKWEKSFNLQYFGCNCIPQWQLMIMIDMLQTTKNLKVEEHKGPQYPFLSLHHPTDHNQIRPPQEFKIEYKYQSKFRGKFNKNWINILKTNKLLQRIINKFVKT